MNIVKIIQHYHPEWEAPKGDIHRWLKCNCPFHGDEVPSAAVCYELDSFSCLGCGIKGNPVTLIQRVERCSHREAVRIAEKIAGGSDRQVQEKPARKSGRRLFS